MSGMKANVAKANTSTSWNLTVCDALCDQALLKIRTEQVTLISASAIASGLAVQLCVFLVVFYWHRLRGIWKRPEQDHPFV